MRESLIALILLLPLPIFAASNEETLQYIIADYQDQCEKAQEDFRDIDYKEGDPVVADLGLSEDNIYEITIDKNGKTATVLHAYFSCTAKVLRPKLERCSITCKLRSKARIRFGSSVFDI